MRVGEWELRRWPDNVPLRGYWSPARPVSGVIAIERGADTWMSLMPVEVESAAIGVACAAGHVAVFGLGLGWTAALCALRPQVASVTVVERDPGVIALHEQLGLFAGLPDGAGAKVRIVAGDAFDWRPDRPVDLLLADIWLPLVGDGRIDEVRRMQAQAKARSIYFWGQELEIAREAVAAGRTRLDDEDIRITAAEIGLPLAGLETPDYAARVRAAAEQWMNEAWHGEARPDFMTRPWHPDWRSLPAA
jgi:hypothetical protein